MTITNFNSKSEKGESIGECSYLYLDSGHFGYTLLYKLTQTASLCCKTPSKTHFIAPRNKKNNIKSFKILKRFIKYIHAI